MKIKIVSPSGAIDPQYIDRATEVLRGWGYEVSEAAHARGKVGRFAASDEERVADIAEALTDPAVDMILCARGGYGLQRIIDRIPPIQKPIIGFSDITALHMLAAQTGQATIHAMMCKGISETKGLSPSSCVLHPSSFLQQALAQEPLHYELPAHPLNRAGKIKGTLIGGNLSVLYGLQGTAYGLDERLRIKDKRLNSNDFKEVRSLGRTQYKDASETKVTSPSSCVLHPSSFIQRGSLFEQALVLDPAASLPADILLRRPDVRAAEQNMARAFYAVNYARSSFFPSLTLSGSLGWTNHSYATIINPMTFISSLAASLFVPLFQSGRNIQQLKMAKSQQREALLMFSQTVLSAGNEVNNALHNYQTLADKQSLYDSQVEALQRAAKATKLKMQYGSTTYLEVLTAQNSLLQAQFTQIANRMQTLQAVVTLYRALGGGSEYKE